jgi:hypothetical protein
MSTNRTRVLTLALPGTALGVLTVVLLTLPLGLGNGSNSPEGLSGWGFLILILGFLGGGGLLFAGWIIALVQTAQIKRWGWFGVLLGEPALTLVLSGVISFYFPWAFLLVPLTLVVYGVVGPTTPAIETT